MAPGSGGAPPPGMTASDLRLELRGAWQRQASKQEAGGRARVAEHALSGILGALLAEFLLFPVDKVKLLMQTAPPEDARGFFTTLAHIAGSQGLQGLYRGIASALLKAGVWSCNFWCWNRIFFGNTSADDTTKTPPQNRLLLNLVAAHLTWLITVPFEVVANTSQLDARGRGFLSTAVHLYKAGGLGQFYRGLGVSLALAVNPAIMGTLITTLLHLAATVKMAAGADYDAAREHRPALVGACTALAKFCATLSTYPLIRAKVLQQTGAARKEEGVLLILRRILRTEGPGGFYKGVLALSYKAALWNFVMMLFKYSLGPKRLGTPRGGGAAAAAGARPPGAPAAAAPGAAFAGCDGGAAGGPEEGRPDDGRGASSRANR